MTNPSETKKTWRVVEFELDARQEELAGWLMIKLGANGCEVEPAGDGNVRLRATFEQTALPQGDLSALTAALDEYGLNKSISSLRSNELQEQDWLSKWKEGFEPFPIGDRLLVCPPWHQEKLTSEQKQGRQIVLIEPGLAFGTGFHETTRFCMLALQDYVDNARKVLDVGTGSGILSIATALLNKQAEIVALENDPTACANARENFAINGVANRVQLLEAGTEKLLGGPSDRFDLILANMTYEDHVALIDQYLQLAAPGGHILFAGILNEKGDQMAELLTKHGLTIVTRDHATKWVGFTARVA